jgi:hypothetical protein
MNEKKELEFSQKKRELINLKNKTKNIQQTLNAIEVGANNILATDL